MTPPDSGEREVLACRYDVREWQSRTKERLEWHRGHGCIYDGVIVPLSLAQRILAALEGHFHIDDCPTCSHLVRELRARMPK